MLHESISATQNLNPALMWVIFAIFVGVALSIDLGMIAKIKEVYSRGQKEKAFSGAKRVRSTNGALA
ncbi:MAG: hypothetical protein ACJ70W_00660, partial [Nitrososphaera sp.]